MENALWDLFKGFFTDSSEHDDLTSSPTLKEGGFTTLLIKSARTTATVGIGANDSNGFAFTVTLSIVLDLEQTEAVQLVNMAHQVCPSSNALHGNIDVKLRVNNGTL